MFSNLWEVSAPIVAKGLRFYPKTLKRWIEASWLAKLEKKIGHPISTIWLFENSRFYDLSFANNRLRIYHQVDLNQNFHVSEAARSADICFCTTEYIKKKLIPFNDKVYKIHHGVSKSLIKNNLTEDQLKSFSTHKINAVYIGNLDIKYLDIGLLSTLTNKFPMVKFHFVGKYTESGELYRNCLKNTNLSWWGLVSSEKIPQILSKCDIQLLSYKVNTEKEIEQMASPHKLMEYIASGKVIVASYTDEYKDKQCLLEMADDPIDYLAKFEKIINNLSFYNSNEKQEKRKQFAKSNTYEEQLVKIFDLLSKNKLKI